MKTQFLLVGVLCAMVKAQNYAYQGQSGHVPIIKNGVPIDTPEVQAARAAHFEAYEKAKALAARKPSTGRYQEFQQQQQYQPQQYQSQHYQPQGYQQQQYQPQQYTQQHYQPPQYQTNVIYGQPGKQHYAIGAYSSEIPIDTPEVQQAKAAHFAALSQAQTHFRTRRNIYHSHVPEETPEVQAAKLQHFIAHASVHDDVDDDHYPADHHQSYYHIPVITKKGVPVDTPEVKVARQKHLIAHQLAKAGAQYAGGYSRHLPVIAPSGVPYDTPEVHVAKVQHQLAHAEESIKQHQWGVHSGYGGGYEYSF